MATYPGNASLSSAVKDRVLSTFQQALALYKEGRAAEVVEGCTLILRMDPMFDPAKKLLEKTRNPNSPVDVDSLMSTHDPLQEARTAMASRDFQRANDLTSEVLRNDFTNEEARTINDTAREKLEAAPFVEQFIRKAETFAGHGNVSSARSELEKARALDSDRGANAGNYQQGIELWSRNFLIDVTNDEASSRIENAKAKRRETETKVEALVAAAERAFNSGDNDTARETFHEVLQLDPGNVAANEFMERNTAAAPAPFETPFSPPSKQAETPAPARRDIFDDDAMLSGSYDSLRP